MISKIFIKSFALFLIVGTTLSIPIYEDFDEDDDIIVIEANDNDERPFDKDDIIDLTRFNGLIFGQPDNVTTGEAVAKYDPTKQSMNPEELGSYYEGDILVPNSPERNGMISQSLRWPGGIIPFEIRGNFNAREMANIERGINEYHAKTCIRFVPRGRESDYISIVNENSGCWSSVGKVGGKQELNLQSPGCTTKHGTFMHEMMHALGFLHEQNRHERDNFITVQWNNIQSGVSHNFDKASSKSTYAFGVPYDFGSIMHYSAHAFSKNGQPTILPKINATIGQRTHLTDMDSKKIRRMYGCDLPEYDYVNSYEDDIADSNNQIFPIFQ